MKKSLFIISALLILSGLSVFGAPQMAGVVNYVTENHIEEQANPENYANLTDESSSLLTGEIITQGEFYNNVTTAWNDGDTNAHFFMIYDGTSDVYVGYKFEKPTIITSAVLYADPRGGGSAFNRIHGTTVEASDDGINWTTLQSVSEDCKNDVVNKINSKIEMKIVSDKPYNYVRYGAKAGAVKYGNGYLCFSEISFYGYDYVVPIENLNFGAKIESQRNTSYSSSWSDGVYTNNSSTDRVFFYNKIGGYNGTDVDAYAGFDYGTHLVNPTKVTIVPHKSKDAYTRIKNSEIQGRNTEGKWITLKELDFLPYKDIIETEDLFITFDIETEESFTALRIYRPAGKVDCEYLGFCDLAFYGTFTFNSQSKLTGSAIFSHEDTSTHYIGNPSYVFDGKVSTMFVANTVGNDGNNIWAGYDFGDKGVSVSSLRYYGRPDSSTPSRIKGQVVQGSEDGVSWETIFTIADGTQGVYKTEFFENSKPYRYIRLNDPDGVTTSFFCQAEIEFYGEFVNKYILSFNSGTITANVPESISVYDGTEINIDSLTIESTDDYEFSGWTDSDGNVVSGTVTIAEDTTLTATWKYKGIVPLSSDKNSIRINDPSGIRFMSSVRNEVKQDNNTTEYGFIVTLETLLGEHDATDLTFEQNTIKYVSATDTTAIHFRT